MYRVERYEPDSTNPPRSLLYSRRPKALFWLTFESELEDPRIGTVVAVRQHILQSGFELIDGEGAYIRAAGEVDDLREGVAHGGVPSRQERRAFEGDGAAGPHGEDVATFVFGVAEVK